MKDILHVTVGDTDWEPTISDMSLICELFKDAQASEDGSVVVTRRGIEVKVHSIEQGHDLRVIKIDSDGAQHVFVEAQNA